METEKSTFSVLTNIEVSEERMSDLLESGFYGGTDHWCCIRSGSIKSLLAGTKNIVIQELGDDMNDYTGKKHELKRDMLEPGLKLLAEKFQHHWNNVLEDNIDADTGDAFIQCAVLGDIVFG